ncbi:trans-sialidase, putative, partial [Trypanosoma cruzi]
EGRESERQRPNMSRHLFHFVLLLLVVIAFGDSGAAGVEEQPADPQFKWKGITGDEILDSLGAPSLLKVGNNVFAVAEAQWKKDDVSFTGIASQILTRKTADTPEEVLKDAKAVTQLLEEGASEDQKKEVDVSRPTTVLKGNDIYMLVGKYSRTTVGDAECKATSEKIKSGILLVKGEVGGDGGNKIRWNAADGLPCTLGDQDKSLKRLIVGGGSGVKIKDETLVFPVEGTKKKAEGSEEDVKTVSLIIYSTDTT